MAVRYTCVLTVLPLVLVKLPQHKQGLQVQNQNGSCLSRSLRYFIASVGTVEINLNQCLEGRDRGEKCFLAYKPKQNLRRKGY